jgi:uncharacterized phiE125 gp8 family phage protein
VEAKKEVDVAASITYHDDHLGRLIKAATSHVESGTGLQVITATVDVLFDRFPSGSSPVKLPLYPLQSITHVKYDDTAGDEQTLSTDVYKSITTRGQSLVDLKEGQIWPATYNEADSVTVRGVFGFADTAADLADKEELLKAIILMVVRAFWLRDHEGSYACYMGAAETLLERYRIGDDFDVYGL